MIRVVLLLGALVAAAADDMCALTGVAPAEPKYALKFCHVFPEESCCSPAQDAEIEEHYFTLLEAGDICAKESSLAKDQLRFVFCMACSPDSPTYVDSDTMTINICQSLADSIEPAKFDDCGMVRVAERGNLCDGDDTVVPSDQWADAAAFLADDSGAKPPFLEDYTVNICDPDTDADCICYDGAGASLRVAAAAVVAVVSVAAYLL